MTEILRKSMLLKLKELINSQRQDKGKTWHIKNEGISRDVIENKRTKFFRKSVSRDVIENNRPIVCTPRC